jgi:hypothetical protein
VSEARAYPGVFAQAANFAASLTHHALAGFPKATDDERAARLEVCRACDRYDAAQVRCKECGCFLAAKTRWAAEACPLGKWGPIVRAPEGCGSCGGGE